MPNISTVYPESFPIPDFIELLKDSPRNFFGTVRQKISDGKSFYSPPLIHRLFRYQKFSETQYRRAPLRNVSIVWDKKFSTKNRDITLWSIKFFDTWNHETLKGSLTYFFGTVRQKIFKTKSWYFPLPLIHKLFRYRKFSETQHIRVALRNFSALWDKKFSTENCDTPFLLLPLIYNFFLY